jgi:tetratricopeptide (TPR) repeat protein
MKTFKSIIILLLFLNSMNTVNCQNDSLANANYMMATDFKKNMKLDSALIYYESASFEFEKAKRIEQFIDSYNQIGIILTRQDKYEEAKTYLDKALSIGLASLDSNHLTIATTYISLGVICNAEEKYDQALGYHYKALAIRLVKLDELHPDVATSYGNLGNVYRNNKEFDKSIEAHLVAMSIREKVFGLTSSEIVESYVGLGNAYKQKKEYKTALEYFEKALKNKIIQRGKDHKDLIRFYKYISDIYYLLNNKAKGDEYKIISEEIDKK